MHHERHLRAIVPLSHHEIMSYDDLVPAICYFSLLKPSSSITIEARERAREGVAWWQHDSSLFCAEKYTLDALHARCSIFRPDRCAKNKEEIGRFWKTGSCRAKDALTGPSVPWLHCAVTSSLWGWQSRSTSNNASSVGSNSGAQVRRTWLH
jgi:hypothetical protein